MNNRTVSQSGFPGQVYIFDVYITTIEVYMAFVSLTILIYASCLHFADEVKYIWKRKLTLPTYLYLFSKYPLFFYLSIYFFWKLPLKAVSESLSLCNDFVILIQVIALLSFIGVQGLISVRTYSLCQGYRPMLIALSITFLAALISTVYASTIPICSQYPASYNIVIEINNSSIILSEMLAFIVVIRQVLGIWRLKRGLGLQSNEDLITSILKQSILRFSFALLITTTEVLLQIFLLDVSSTLNLLQIILSTVLTCEFTLDLRQRNTPISVSALDLPTLSFREDPVNSVRSVLGRFHETIVAEMGERDDPLNNNDGLDSQESDGLPNDPNDIISLGATAASVENHGEEP